MDSTTIDPAMSAVVLEYLIGNFYLLNIPEATVVMQTGLTFVG